MVRNLSFAVVLSGLVVSFAIAQTPAQPGGTVVKNQPMWGKISKVQGNNIYFSPYDPATKQYGTAKAYPVTQDNFKLFEMKGKDQLPIQNGLKADHFTNIPETGLYGTLQMNKDSINQIQLWQNEANFLQGLQAVPPNPNPGIEK